MTAPLKLNGNKVGDASYINTHVTGRVPAERVGEVAPTMSDSTNSTNSTNSTDGTGNTEDQNNAYTWSPMSSAGEGQVIKALMKMMGGDEIAAREALWEMGGSDVPKVLHALSELTQIVMAVGANHHLRILLADMPNNDLARHIMSTADFDAEVQKRRAAQQAQVDKRNNE